MRFEGGFQGRCNKLVDGCYSFWQAGLLPLLHRALHAQGEPGCWRGWRLPSAADRVGGQGAWLEGLKQALSILDFEYPVWTLPP